MLAIASRFWNDQVSFDEILDRSLDVSSLVFWKTFLKIVNGCVFAADVSIKMHFS